MNIQNPHQKPGNFVEYEFHLMFVLYSAVITKGFKSILSQKLMS